MIMQIGNKGTDDTMTCALGYRRYASQFGVSSTNRWIANTERETNMTYFTEAKASLP